MKRISIWVCALLFAAECTGAGGMAVQAWDKDSVRVSTEQNMREIEDYVNQKNEDEAEKEKAKRGDQARKPPLPIYSAEK